MTRCDGIGTLQFEVEMEKILPEGCKGLVADREDPSHHLVGERLSTACDDLFIHQRWDTGDFFSLHRRSAEGRSNSSTILGISG
ncbi:hypothetical protein C4D60_Mb01t01670 [Musa balbisiana]|uniref:Uncharacterized protein n=1 Tax=Musa balbisiana TaxID=52838 RepID=A0A4S8JJ42_MUSBA|nr:hypothetical protein C4D60_Mb01t01670 [Musa balbisiana]